MPNDVYNKLIFKGSLDEFINNNTIESAYNIVKNIFEESNIKTNIDNNY